MSHPDVDPLWLTAKPATAHLVRAPRCRKLDKNQNRCQSEEQGDSGLCVTHLLDAYSFVREQIKAATGRKAS